MKNPIKLLMKRGMKRGTTRTVVVLFTVLGVLGFFMPIQPVGAAALTGMKDTMSRLEKSVAGTHAFSFTTATNLTATQTITIAFDTAADSFTLDGTIASTDFSAASGLTIVANIGACAGATDEVYPSVDASAPGESYTLTVCTGDTVPAGAIAFTIDNNEITNPSSAAVYKIDITTTSDSGSFAVAILDDDTVNVTATVDPSVTFSISDVAIGFGVLDATQECWANGTPPAACDTTPEAAHTFQLGTNATDGVALTYTGATLTSGGDTISVATIAGDADGTPGSEQFAIGFDDNAATFTFADTAAYDESANNFKFVAGTTTAILSIAGPTAAATIDAHYIANISAATEAGSYSTAITYIATGTF
ncbi:MAG: hypothetical protein WCV85_05800 [Patescibacteria group bacterium]|jgi:hypothetical protein